MNEEKIWKEVVKSQPVATTNSQLHRKCRKKAPRNKRQESPVSSAYQRLLEKIKEKKNTKEKNYSNSAVLLARLSIAKMYNVDVYRHMRKHEHKQQLLGHCLTEALFIGVSYGILPACWHASVATITHYANLSSK